MRMWMVDPKLMCRKHLLGEHVEIHMFVSTILSGKSIKGYIKNNLIEPSKILERHEELVEEMKRRGYKHNSPLNDNVMEQIKNKLSESDYNTIIDKESSLLELKSRCKYFDNGRTL